MPQQIYYQGMTLQDYCLANDLDYNYIRIRMWKKRNNPKYKDYSEEDIIKLVIDAIGTGVKLTYNGISLAQYCKDNNINYSTIRSRIETLKIINPNLSIDELVKKALEEFVNNNYRYFYHGKNLIEFGKDHPDINLSLLRNFIRRTKEENPHLTDEEIIDIYVAKEHKGVHKWYYQGIPLKEYCEKNNISYNSLMTIISKKRNQFMDLSDDEFIEQIMSQYNPLEVKYYYEGETLRQYCLKHHLNYDSITHYVKRKLKIDPNQKQDSLINEAIQYFKRYGIIYYYQGIPLKEYAETHNMNFSRLRRNILKKSATSSKSLDEIVQECVEIYQSSRTKYYYKGVTLRSYCKANNLSYDLIHERYIKKYAGRSDISFDDAITEIIDYCIERPPINTKYYYEGESLKRFCDTRGYSYSAIYTRIRRAKSNCIVFDYECSIKEAIHQYEKKIEFKNIRDVFEKIKKAKNFSDNELQEFCEILKIDYETLLDLLSMEFTFNQAFNIIWYFSDNLTDKSYKSITDIKLQSIFAFVNRIKNATTKEIEKMDLYTLIGIYKCDIFDSRNEILIKLEKYIAKNISYFATLYGININRSNYEEFQSEFKIYIIEIIERSQTRYVGQFIKYMDKTLKGMIRQYFKNYKVLMAESLDKEVFEGKKLGDFLPVEDKNFKKIEENTFSPTMQNALSKLSPHELNFIILRFQENYSYQELADQYSTSIEEIQEYEKKILSVLKQNLSLENEFSI